MTLTSLAINGQAIEDLGLAAINLADWLSPPTIVYGHSAPIGRMGTKATTRGITYSRTPLTLGLKDDAGTITASRTALGTAYLALQGDLEIESVDAPGRVIHGLFTSGVTTVFGSGPSTIFLSSNLEFVGKIEHPDPFWYDRIPLPIGGVAAQRVVLPMGTAPTRLRIQLAGAYTTPTFTLRDRAGNVLGQLRLSDTAASSTTWLDLDFGAGSIDRWVSNVRSSQNNGFQYLNVADKFLVADPLDAPTLECSSGSWAGAATRAWLV